MARNTFLLAKYIPTRPTPLEPQWGDDVLHYGQKIRLLANPMAQVSWSCANHSADRPEGFDRQLKLPERSSWPIS